MQYNRRSPTATHDMTDALNRLHRPAAARGRFVSWLVIAVFLLQFFAAAEHHHEPKAKTAHCVSCTLHAQAHAAPPDTRLAPVATGWILLHDVVHVAVLHTPLPRPAFLLPPAQGPPAFLPT